MTTNSTTGRPVADFAGVLVQQRVRLREIAGVLAKYGFTRLADRTLDAEKHPAGQATGHLTADLADPQIAQLTTGERARGALTELGTTWIKLGQMLSVRPDLVGPDVADELTRLQADVPADPAPYAEDLVAAELGQPVAEVFVSFEGTAMASGSVAQVHRATLTDGTEVVVKVLHAGVERTVTSDLELMRALAVFLESVDDELARYRPVVLVAEFDAMMRAAIDLTQEQANLKRFTRNFAAEPDVAIPGYHPTLSSAKVLTMERMVGDKLTDRAAVQERGWVINDLVDRTTGIYLEMIFRDGAYHADPHPGNFLLRPGKEIVILDFGDVGYLSSTRQEQLETLLIAMNSRDLDDLTASIVDITDAPADTDLDRLRADIDRWSSQYLNDELADLDFAGMISSAMDLMHTHALSMPSDLATLFRVLVLLQGMGANLGATNKLGPLMEPYVNQMIKKRLDPRTIGRQALKSARSWSDLLRVLPGDLRDLMAQIKDGQVDVDFQLHDPDGRVDQVVDGMIVAAMVIAAGELLSRQTRPILGQISLPGTIAVALGLLSYRRLRGKRDDYVTAMTRMTRLLKFARTRPTAGSSG